MNNDEVRVVGQPAYGKDCSHHGKHLHNLSTIHDHLHLYERVLDS